MKIIAIVGSRDYPMRICQPLFKWLGDLLETVQRDIARQRRGAILPPFMLVSGDGGNVDLSVRRMCLETHRLPFMAFPADWNGPLQRGAGPIRNGYIAQVAHAGIAIHDGHSTGTLDTMTKIERRSMPTLIVYPHIDPSYQIEAQMLAFLKETLQCLT